MYTNKSHFNYVFLKEFWGINAKNVSILENIQAED